MRSTLMVLSLAACTSYADVEQENGFRDVRLGSALSDVSGLVVHKDEGTGEIVYERPTDGMMWGPAPLGTITYHFWDEHLWMVRIRTGDSKSLLSVMSREYGTPPFSTPWQWDGPTVRMNFRGTEYDTTATVTIVKTPLEKVREAERPARLAAKRDRLKAEGALKKAEADRKKAEAAAKKAEEAAGEATPPP